MQGINGGSVLVVIMWGEVSINKEHWQNSGY